MSDRDTEYTNLPFLDNVDQPYCESAAASSLKIPLRNAINGCRFSEDAMNELIQLLETSLTHIHSCRGKKKRRVKKKEEVEYDLP